jgi:hypothetical protein
MNIRGEGESILRDAADRAAPFDPELAATLRDMASDYAGPQVSDEDRKQEQR